MTTTRGHPLRAPICCCTWRSSVLRRDTESMLFRRLKRSNDRGVMPSDPAPVPPPCDVCGLLGRGLSPWGDPRGGILSALPSKRFGRFTRFGVGGLSPPEPAPFIPCSFILASPLVVP